MERKPLNRSDISRPFMFCLKALGFLVCALVLITLIAVFRP